jgi:amino acid transporter
LALEPPTIRCYNYNSNIGNNLNYSLGEMKDPVKNLPRAVGGGVIIVALLYICANLSYLIVLPASVMVASEELVAGVFFKHVLGSM